MTIVVDTKAAMPRYPQVGDTVLVRSTYTTYRYTVHGWVPLTAKEREHE